MTEREIIEALQVLIRQTFSAPDATVTQETTAEDIPGWDSLSHTVLIVAAEDRFGVALDAEQPFANLGELAEAIRMAMSA